ncbi:MAG TPA: phosphatidylglycerol lysyltransferase domain-containing protein [Methanosarcina sp.]|nr:phosphatidylglycerol lysyltransferase domain-containing protein [Methanosarcina sp.]
MLSQKDFKPVTLADRAFFERHYALYPQTHSDNTFTSMICWTHSMHYRYAYVKGNVILECTAGGVTRLHPPIGLRDPALMLEIIQLALDMGNDKPLTLVDPETAKWMKKTDPDIMLVPDLNHFEYVYRARDLAELPGKKYLKIRSQINKFRKKYRHSVEQITPENREEIMEFLVKWCETKKCEDNFILAHEIEAVSYAIEHLTELPLKGLLIRVDSQVGAISLFERLNANTALIHFEKGLPEYNGIYKVINAETAAVLASEVEYINRESDLGISGLRKAKLRYHPHHMVEVYYLKRRTCFPVIT